MESFAFVDSRFGIITAYIKWLCIKVESRKYCEIDLQISNSIDQISIDFFFTFESPASFHLRLLFFDTYSKNKSMSCVGDIKRKACINYSLTLG